jgi:hypothetical protein
MSHAARSYAHERIKFGYEHASPNKTAFFLDGSRLTNPTQADWQALYRAHGLEIVGPPLKLD